MVTPLTLKASMPFRAVRSWSKASAGQGAAAVPLLPSTITRFRSMPRRWMPGLVIMTPASGVAFS